MYLVNYSKINIFTAQILQDFMVDGSLGSVILRKCVRLVTQYLRTCNASVSSDCQYNINRYLSYFSNIMHSVYICKYIASYLIITVDGSDNQIL